jgi:hypothetical protein
MGLTNGFAISQGHRVVCNNVEDAYRFIERLKETLPGFPGKVEVQDQIAKPNPADDVLPQNWTSLNWNFPLMSPVSGEGEFPKASTFTEAQIAFVFEAGRGCRAGG